MAGLCPTLGHAGRLCHTQGHVTVFCPTKGHASGLCHAIGHVFKLGATTWHRGPPLHHHRAWGCILPEDMACHRIVLHHTARGGGGVACPARGKCTSSLFHDKACRSSLPHNSACTRTFSYHAVAVGGGGCRGTRLVGALCATKLHEGELRPPGGMCRATLCTTTGHLGGSLPHFNAHGQTSAQWRACKKTLRHHMGWRADFAPAQGLQAHFSIPYGMRANFASTRRMGADFAPPYSRPKGRSSGGSNHHSSCNGCGGEVGARQVALHLFTLVPACPPHLFLAFFISLWLTFLTAIYPRVPE